MANVVGYYVIMAFCLMGCCLTQPAKDYGWGKPVLPYPTRHTYTPPQPYFLKEGFKQDPSTIYVPPRNQPPPQGNRYIALPNQPPVSFRNYLSAGGNRILEGCSQYGRQHCNPRIPRPTQGQCNRWLCCWDPRSPVICAKNVYHIVKLEANANQCGIQPAKFLPNLPTFISMITLQSRILGGTVTQQGDWPWVVSLRIAGTPSCGGTIIDSEWILTAAHCLRTEPTNTRLAIVTGELNTAINGTRDRFHSVIDRRLPPAPNAFQNSGFNNDIALLKISPPVKLDKFRRPCCITDQGRRTDDDLPPTFAGKECVVIGWGATSTTPTSDLLLEAKVTILSTSQCQDATQTAPPMTYNPDAVVFGDDSKFCATGTVNGDTCSGDSGGPLLCLDDDDRWKVIGVTSYGPNICGTNPAVYTRVSDFTNWIRTVIVT